MVKRHRYNSVAPFNVCLLALKDWRQKNEQFGPVAPALLLDVTIRGGQCPNRQ
jgi:hypothetical protein